MILGRLCKTGGALKYVIDRHCGHPLTFSFWDYCQKPCFGLSISVSAGIVFNTILHRLGVGYVDEIIICIVLILSLRYYGKRR